MFVPDHYPHPPELREVRITGTSMLLTHNCRTLIGNPASAVILTRYQSNGLLAFLAAVLFSGMISAAALRWLSHGRRWIFKARV
jgi:hypothetical protein